MNAAAEVESPKYEVPVVAPELPAVTTPMMLLRIATQSGADIEKLTKLMDLQDRWEKTEARKAFVEAMALFKSNPVTITKNKRVNYANKTGGRTDYTHATLDNVCRQIIVGLSAVGISHRWATTQENGNIKVTCILTHRGGHFETTALEARADESGGKNGIQAIGSTVTYLERYTLLAATGIAVKDQDDDGVGAGARLDDSKVVHRVEPRTTVDVEGPTPREAQPEQPRKAAPVSGKPMNDGQRRIITAKLKNAGLTDTDLSAKFGKALADPSWQFDDFKAVTEWIASRAK